MSNEEELYPDYNLWVLFSQTRDAIAKARERELLSEDISERHAQMLFIIKQIGHEATPARISRWLLREPHSISEIINRMEKQELIKKVKDLERKNHVRIEITEKGEDQYRRSFIPSTIPDTFSTLSGDERSQLIDLLMKLRSTAIANIGAKYAVPLPPIED